MMLCATQVPNLGLILYCLAILGTGIVLGALAGIGLMGVILKGGE